MRDTWEKKLIFLCELFGRDANEQHDCPKNGTSAGERGSLRASIHALSALRAPSFSV